MDDKYYYKIRQVQAEMQYLGAMLDESEDGLIKDENKRKMCYILLADILRNTAKIQTQMGTEFIPEFKDG
jgi:hypothetical protein